MIFVEKFPELWNVLPSVTPPKHRLDLWKYESMLVTPALPYILFI